MVRILDLEKYAKENNVPIMLPDGIEFLLEYIKKHNVKRVLEIGSAIGYSAIRMALVSSDISVTTIERDEERFREAVNNIKAFGLEKQINIIHADAFEVEITGEYDLIFIDAAKSQYIKFFQKFEKNLKPSGTIISDNLSFHGLVENKEQIELSKNVKGLVRKINEYIKFLKEHSEFETTFLSIGDGIGISVKKEKEL